MRLLLTRPRVDAEPLAERLRAAGHQVTLAPLLDIRPLAPAPFDLSGVQAVLLTSANGARAVPPSAPLRALPAFVVGAATAQAARAAGFAQIECAAGDVEALARLVASRLDPADGALLHIASRQRAGDLGAALGRLGFGVRRAVLYEAVAARLLPGTARAALEEGAIDAVLLYSPRTAATFAKLVGAAGLAAACRRIEALCLSRAVADALRGLAWRGIRVAPRPEQEALLALLDGDRQGA
jgi:uroporphyrinogen-III synthase